MSRAGAVGVALLVLAGTGGCSGSGLPGPAAPAPSADWSSATPSAGGWLVVTVRMGDRCPHVPASPDPSCDPLPLAGAPIQVRSGGAVEEVVTEPGGIVRLPLDPGPVEVAGRAFGRYEQTSTSTARIEPGATTTLILTYVTGIQ